MGSERTLPVLDCTQSRRFLACNSRMRLLICADLGFSEQSEVGSPARIPFNFQVRVVGGWWRLAVGGGWWLAIGGPLGRSLRAARNQKK